MTIHVQPVIMAGDFNDRPESRVMTRMLSLWADASAGNPMPSNGPMEEL